MDVLENYTGHVEPGGPATQREAGALRITKLSVGPMDNNAYLLVCTRTGDALLIDAANEPERLQAMIDAVGGLPVRTILTTHQHFDHVQALAAMASATGATTVAHPDDAPELPLAPDVLLRHGEALTVGEVQLRAIHLRGHTPGSIALYYDDPSGQPHLFTGDSLFPGGPGKTWSPEDFTSLMDDLESRIFGELPDETWFYPGHGDDSTLGAERPSVPDWRARGW